MTADVTTLSATDARIVAACLSLGCASTTTLFALFAAGKTRSGFDARMRRLRCANYVAALRPQMTGGIPQLYAVGRRALKPGQAAPWRPRLGQLEHTLAIGDTVVAAMRPGFAAPTTIVGWRGEAELRGWALPGAPFPDVEVDWELGQFAGTWQVEVDRGTESRPVWRRKLLRYLTGMPHATVLTVTTGDERARNLAAVGEEVGVHVLALSAASFATRSDPFVYDSADRQQRPLSHAALAQAGLPATGWSR